MSVEGDKVRLAFDHVGGGLVSRDGKPLTDFTIAGAEKKFHPATATIDGDAVVVESKERRPARGGPLRLARGRGGEFCEQGRPARLAFRHGPGELNGGAIVFANGFVFCCPSPSGSDPTFRSVPGGEGNRSNFAFRSPASV